MKTHIAAPLIFCFTLVYMLVAQLSCPCWNLYACRFELPWNVGCEIWWILRPVFLLPGRLLALLPGYLQPEVARSHARAPQTSSETPLLPRAAARQQRFHGGAVSGSSTWRCFPRSCSGHQGWRAPSTPPAPGPERSASARRRARCAGRNVRTEGVQTCSACALRVAANRVRLRHGRQAMPRKATPS